jgi:hypothetical protein
MASRPPSSHTRPLLLAVARGKIPQRREYTCELSLHRLNHFPRSIGYELDVVCTFRTAVYGQCQCREIVPGSKGAIDVVGCRLKLPKLKAEDIRGMTVGLPGHGIMYVQVILLGASIADIYCSIAN